MKERERQQEIMRRVKRNIERDREVQVGSLEMQSWWGEWRELILKTDMR